MMRSAILWFSVVALACLALCDDLAGSDATLSPPDPAVNIPLETVSTWHEWRRIALLRDYNTRVVVVGTTLLGLAAGAIGSITLLRKRALMGDALSHATLPGIGLAFLIATYFGWSGKSLPLLLAGGATSGLLGMAVILAIRNLTRLKEDAALGIVLSVFFGAGVAVLGVVQQMKSGHAAGLEAFIYGKTASMVSSDAWLIGGAGAACAVVCALLIKELRLLCFDESFAVSRGYPVVALDIVLMVLVVTITIVGLQAVGLILMIALLVVPAAAARFWTQRLSRMTLAAAVFGAISGMIGSLTSAILPHLPSGAMIVLCAASLFALSLFFGPARGVLVRMMRRGGLNKRVDRRHLLRGIYEHLETRGQAGDGRQRLDSALEFADLLAMRSWSPARLRRTVRRSERAGLTRQEATAVRLTEAGFREAARLVQEHRLWELYLITYADIAPSQVDRDADTIEHVLDSEMIERLETLLEQKQSTQGIADSPHPIEFAGASATNTPTGPGN